MASAFGERHIFLKKRFRRRIFYESLSGDRQNVTLSASSCIDSWSEPLRHFAVTIRDVSFKLVAQPKTRHYFSLPPLSGEVVNAGAKAVAHFETDGRYDRDVMKIQWHDSDMYMSASAAPRNIHRIGKTKWGFTTDVVPSDVDLWVKGTCVGKILYPRRYTNVFEAARSRFGFGLIRRAILNRESIESDNASVLQAIYIALTLWEFCVSWRYYDYHDTD